MATKYFKYAFAVDGTTIAIPNTGANPGDVSYQYGFTSYYEDALGTDPNALPIPRPQSNDLYFDITSNIQQYQQYGNPELITSADNSPDGAFPYPLYATVFYDAGNGLQLWENQVAANTTLPGVDSTWLLANVASVGNPPGTIIDFGGIALPGGYLPTDGTAQLRASYPNLFAALTSVQSCVLTGSNPAFTVANLFGLYVGMKVESSLISSTICVITAINTGTNQVTVSVAPSGSGTVNVRFFQWDNGNGTTTFNVPFLTGYVTAGQGGAGIPVDSGSIAAPGQRGGLAARQLVANNLPEHTHATSSASVTFTGIIYDKIGGGAPNLLGGNGGNAHPISNSNLPSMTSTVSVTVGNNTTTNTGFNVVQPTAITYKLVKT